MSVNDNYTNPYFNTEFPAFQVNYSGFDNEFEFNNEQAWINRMYNTWEREQTQEYNTSMWNAYNDYHDIGSQMQRAREAGVNPAAIVNGDFKGSAASPPQSTPQGSSPASVQGSTGNMVNAAKNVADSGNALANHILQREMVDSTIKVNEKNLIEIASRAGLNDANADSIRKSARWIDDLSYADFRKTVAEEVKLYNESAGILQGIEESKSRVDVNESEVSLNNQLENESVSREMLTNRQHEAQVIENKYLEKSFKANASIDEIRAWEMQQRKSLATIIGLPLGTSEFEFNYGLHKKGLFKEYYDNVAIPNEVSKWKLSDFLVPYTEESVDESTMKFLGIPTGYDTKGTKKGNLDFIRMHPIFNTSLSNPNLILESR